MASVPVVHLVHFVLLVAAAWLAVGALGLGVLHRTRLVAHGLFPLGALAGLLLGAAGLAGVFAEPSTLVLPVGLPGLPFHLRLDRLSGYFLFVLGIVTAGIGAFSAGYFRKGEGTAPGLICFEYHVCVASIALVLIGNIVADFTLINKSFNLNYAGHDL